jgi:hypothetical protein
MMLELVGLPDVDRTAGEACPPPRAEGGAGGRRETRRRRSRRAKSRAALPRRTAKSSRGAAAAAEAARARARYIVGVVGNTPHGSHGQTVACTAPLPR